MSGYSALRLLEATDVVGTFDSGTPTLDEYLKKRALANQVGDIARCYVTTHSGSVVGYHTLSAGAILRSELPKAHRKNTPDVSPVFVIGRLAVDLKHRGQGLGSGLVRHAILRSVEGAQLAGIKLLLVHTQNDQAAAFWRHHGFDPMPENEYHLVLAMQDARAALGNI